VDITHFFAMKIIWSLRGSYIHEGPSWSWSYGSWIYNY